MCTQFVRDNKPVTLRWGYWHLGCFLEAMEMETGKKDSSFFEMNGYEFKGSHEFVDDSDGEILSIIPGDTVLVWRD